jgi:hypothetical protein
MMRVKFSWKGNTIYAVLKDACKVKLEHEHDVARPWVQEGIKADMQYYFGGGAEESVTIRPGARK